MAAMSNTDDRYGSQSDAPFAQGVLDSLPNPAILINRQYDVLLSNAAYRERYGLLTTTAAAAPKPKCHQVSHRFDQPCDQAGETCPLAASLESGQVESTLHIHFTPTGREYVRVEMWPIRDSESGEVTCFIEQIYPAHDLAAVEAIETPSLAGRSTAFRQMLDLVQRVAPTATNVLLLGETGTGKELVAQTIHQQSERSDGPFVPVECTGLPESLFESELFGYVKGAFTGAESNRSGLVESAAGGTLFLDEVGDIPLQDQVKLLRLLETQRFRKVGDPDWQQADFRLVCATNRNLKEMVEEGEFRADLFYRLSVFEINLPPLRERKEDIPLLVDRITSDLGKPDHPVSSAAMDLLRRYAFPGNIRELRNLIERAMVLAGENSIAPRHLPGLSGEITEDQTTATENGIRLLAEVESDYLRQVAASWQGDRKSLAEKLGISERALYRKLASLKES